jgi:hypothetical protein
MQNEEQLSSDLGRILKPLMISRNKTLLPAFLKFPLEKGGEREP